MHRVVLEPQAQSQFSCCTWYSVTHTAWHIGQTMLVPVLCRCGDQLHLDIAHCAILGFTNLCTIMASLAMCNTSQVQL